MTEEMTYGDKLITLVTRVSAPPRITSLVQVRNRLDSYHLGHSKKSYLSAFITDEMGIPGRCEITPVTRALPTRHFVIGANEGRAV
jgi:hypothetical protein